MAETKWSSALRHHFNFFRIHLTLFTLVPIIAAVILSALSGEFNVKYVDALFLCISGMTSAGLYTVDLSALTPWQQVLLLLVSLVGSPVFGSLITVYLRRRYFTSHLKSVVQSVVERYKTHELARGRTSSVQQSAGRAASDRRTYNIPSSSLAARRVDTEHQPISSTNFGGILPQHTSPRGSQAPRPDERYSRHDTLYESPRTSALSVHQTQAELRPHLRLTRHGTVRTTNPQQDDDLFGGFPNPLSWLGNALHHFFPSLKRKIRRMVTIPRAPDLFVSEQKEIPQGADPDPYLHFRARIRHNSCFIGLSDDNYEELGGMEYRALTVLLWVVSAYNIVTLLIPFAVLAPYMSMSKWKSNFVPPSQHRVINPIWYSAFQVVSARANVGWSLVDQNLVPFQTAYLLLIVTAWLALVGNTGFPVFLRLCIWIWYKSTRKGSKWRDTFRFILDHPRRCYLYLFPSRQTWFLLAVLIVLILTDWLFFLVLNIGMPAFDTIPVGRRFLLGFVQAVSVRSAGFQAITVSSLAPAQQVLYFVMMYIAPYPITMSVRSTNVYEERSLGISKDENDDQENEADHPESDSGVAVWGRYLGRHVRRQLSFDLWWIALALFLICILERGQLRNPANASWFTIFAIFFEIVSAYSTVGLSLGVPSQNYSLSGAMSKFSKLVLCAVMLRGNHSSLPVALDRAILFPTEFARGASEKAGEMMTQQAGATTAEAGMVARTATTTAGQGGKLASVHEMT